MTCEALVLAWLGLGLWQTAVVRRRSRPAPQWSRALLAHVVGDSGAAPDLLVSGWLAQPVALGLLRPAIILPERFVKDEPRCRLECRHPSRGLSYDAAGCGAIRPPATKPQKRNLLVYAEPARTEE